MSCATAIDENAAKIVSRETVSKKLRRVMISLVEIVYR
jgi:hypothetical protein